MLFFKERKSNIILLVLLIILMAAIISSSSLALGTYTPYGPFPRPATLAPNGLVTSQTPLSSEAGLKMLRQGGTVADALLAVEAVLTLVDGGMSGIGGEGFSLIYIAEEDRLVGLNHTGTAPKSPELVERGKEVTTLYNIMNSPVPATIGGLLRFHERYGKLPLSTVLEPAIGYAVNGFPVTEKFHSNLLAGSRGNMGPIFEFYPTSFEIYFPMGKDPEVYDLLYNPNYARTLRLIAEGGYNAFYKGPIAREIDRFYKEMGGVLSYEDLASYEPEWVEPIHTTYRGYDIYTMPPNSSGLNILQELNVLEGFDIKSMEHNSADYVHLLAEVFKLAMADRDAYVGDPRFVDVPLDTLISKEYAESQRKRIDMEHVIESVPGLELFADVGGTTSIVIADAYGNMVATTPTVGYWGSGIIIGNLGFWTADGPRRMSLKEGHANELKPGKRNQWNMAPTFVFHNGQPLFALASSGNVTIWQTQVQVILNIIDFGMELQQAVSAPRLAYRTNLQLDSDGGWTDETISELERRGHKIALTGVGGLWSIMRAKNGLLIGAAEPRQDSVAVGW